MLFANPQQSLDGEVLLFEDGTESKLYLVSSYLNYSVSEVDDYIPIKGRSVNVGEPIVVISGEVLNNYFKDYFFTISGDLYRSNGEKLVGSNYIMNRPMGEFVVLHVSLSERGIFELVFKYDGQDIESYDLYLAYEPEDYPPP